MHNNAMPQMRKPPFRSGFLTGDGGVKQRKDKKIGQALFK